VGVSVLESAARSQQWDVTLSVVSSMLSLLNSPIVSNGAGSRRMLAVGGRVFQKSARVSICSVLTIQGGEDS